MFLSKLFPIPPFFLKSAAFHLCQLLQVPPARGRPSSSFLLSFSPALSLFSLSLWKNHNILLSIFSGQTSASFLWCLGSSLSSWPLAWCCSVPELEGIIAGRIPYNPCVPGRTLCVLQSSGDLWAPFFYFIFFFPQDLMEMVKFNWTLLEVKGGSALKLSWWAPLSW